MIPQIGPFATGRPGVQILEGQVAGRPPAGGHGPAASAGATSMPAVALTQPSGPAVRPLDEFRPPLIPPDPDAPAGPPPTFEASILDRLRERAKDPVPSIARADASDAGFGARDLPEGPRGGGAAAFRALYDVPPSPEARAEAEVSALRSLSATPGDARRIDVSR